MTSGVFPYRLGNVSDDISSENKIFASRIIDFYNKSQDSKKGIYLIIVCYITRKEPVMEGWSLILKNRKILRREGLMFSGVVFHNLYYCIARNSSKITRSGIDH
jgi:hypothetical protein